jgi:hypothetical protein
MEQKVKVNKKKCAVVKNNVDFLSAPKIIKIIYMPQAGLEPVTLTCHHDSVNEQLNPLSYTTFSVLIYFSVCL